MSTRTDLISKHTSNQTALIRHILEAVERQRSDDAVRNHLEANKIIIEIERVLKSQAQGLESLASKYGSEGESTIKKVVAEVLGMAAGVYDKVREQEVSRMLRDDYTALSLAAMGYTAYHTFGLVAKEQAIADTALKYLKEITPLLVSLSQVLPRVVADEVTRDMQDFQGDMASVAKAVDNTQEAWSNEVTRSGNV